MNDKNWNPGTFLPDTISGKELIKTFLKSKMICAEWIALSVAAVPQQGPGLLLPLTSTSGRRPLGPIRLFHPPMSAARSGARLWAWRPIAGTGAGRASDTGSFPPQGC